MNGFLVFPLLVAIVAIGVFVMLVRKEGFRNAWGRITAFGAAVGGALVALVAGLGTPPGV